MELQAATQYHHVLQAFHNTTQRLLESGNVSAELVGNLTFLVHHEPGPSPADWDFAGSAFFAFTITTAIG